MRRFTFARVLSIAVLVLAFGLVAAGCGDDNSDGSQTNPGAPAGATGTEAGGAAVEAGKQRPEQEIENEKKTYGEEPPPVNLQQGERSGFKVSKPTIVIARSNKELNAMQKDLKAKGVSTEIAPVDFKTRQAVLVQFDKVAPGVLTQISSVNQVNGKIVVKTVVLSPGNGCPTGKSTNPFSIVETRQMKGTPKLELQQVDGSPCK